MMDPKQQFKIEDLTTKWEEEKSVVEMKLEEALMINTKLFDKVKRLEI